MIATTVEEIGCGDFWSFRDRTFVKVAETKCESACEECKGGWELLARMGDKECMGVNAQKIGAGLGLSMRGSP
jgi:hypothetical protein